MLEINYDASEGQANWKEFGSRALQLHHFQLATRAEGEQGIAAFLLGDTETAKKKCLKPGAFHKLKAILPLRFGTRGPFRRGSGTSSALQRGADVSKSSDQPGCYTAGTRLPYYCRKREDRCPSWIAAIW